MSQKIVSFCLYGSKSQYVEGAVANARLYPQVFPGWTCRFYVNDTTDEVVAALEAEGAQVIRKGETSEGLGMYYRFLPLLDDPSVVERFIVRDTDSKPCQREYDAVRQWEESGLPFHIIRDAPVHNIRILGGTWGAIPGCVPAFEVRLAAWMTTLQPAYNNPRGPFHGTDQMFLHAAVWPFIEDCHLAHIQAGQPQLRFTDRDVELPPLEPDGHFVGMPC